MKKRAKIVLVTALSASSPLGWSVTTVNPDGFSTDLPLAAGSGIIAAGFGNESSAGNFGYLAADESFFATAGGNFLAGSNNKALTSDSSISAGIGNILLNQEGSMAMGLENKMNFPAGTNGAVNFAFGYSNRIIANAQSMPWGCFLFGGDNESNTAECWVLGKGNIGQYETVTLGTNAAEVPDASLIVGTGTGGGNTPRTNGLVVLKNGTVSIPSGLLQLAGQNALTASYLSSNNYLTKAFGFNSNAASSSVAAIGAFSEATQTNGLALGYGAKSWQANALAVGSYSKAEGVGSLGLASGWAAASGAVAVQGWAHASESIAIGPYTRVYGAGSTAIGYGANTTVNGLNSLALGKNATTENQYSTAVGFGTKASGDGSNAVGHASTAIGKYSSTLGFYTIAHSYSVTALGSLNIGNQGNTTNWIESDPVFELGNSNDGNNRSNAITTLKNGQTTLINKAWKANVAANPAQTLADPPATTTDSGGEALVVDGHTRLRGKVVIEQPQGDISMGIYGN